MLFGAFLDKVLKKQVANHGGHLLWITGSLQVAKRVKSRTRLLRALAGSIWSAQ